MRVVYGTRINSLTTGSITASSEESNFEVTRLKDDRLSVRWRTTSNSSESVIFDMGSAVSADSICICGHNMTATSGTVLLQANSADSWTTPGLSTGVTVRSGSIVTFFTSTSARYWKVTLDDSSLTYIEIGKILLEEYYEFSPTSLYEFPLRRTRTDNVSYTQGGQLYSDVGKQFVELDYNFPESSDTVKSNVENLWNSVGKYRPFVFCNYNTTYTVVEPIYCTITNDVEFQKKMYDRWTFNLNLREAK